MLSTANFKLIRIKKNCQYNHKRQAAEGFLQKSYQKDNIWNVHTNYISKMPSHDLSTLQAFPNHTGIK